MRAQLTVLLWAAESLCLVAGCSDTKRPTAKEVKAEPKPPPVELAFDPNNLGRTKQWFFEKLKLLEPRPAVNAFVAEEMGKKAQRAFDAVRAEMLGKKVRWELPVLRVGIEEVKLEGGNDERNEMYFSHWAVLKLANKRKTGYAAGEVWLAVGSDVSREVARKLRNRESFLTIEAVVSELSYLHEGPYHEFYLDLQNVTAAK